MGCRVEYRPLGDLVSLSSGGTPNKSVRAYWEGEIPWISAKEMGADFIGDSSLHISKDGLEAGSKIAPKGSILLLTRGSGLFNGIPLCMALRDLAFNQDVKCLTSKASDISNDYIFYALKASESSITGMLETTGIGAGKLSTDRLLGMPLPVLDTDSRNRFVSFCQSIYQKIEVNNRINDYLEQICQTMFDEFDSDTVNPFVTISEVADVNPKRAIKKGEEALCVEMSDLSTSGSFPSGWKTRPYNGGMKFMNGDTIMARITPCLENGKASYINFLNDEQIAFGSTEYITMATKGILPSEFFYFLARNRDFVSYAVAHMNGSSGRQRVSSTDIERYEIRMPSTNQIKRFEQTAGPAMGAILANSLENRQLHKLRDTLLPRLISGEICISEIKPPTQPNNHLSYD